MPLTVCPDFLATETTLSIPQKRLTAVGRVFLRPSAALSISFRSWLAVLGVGTVSGQRDAHRGRHPDRGRPPNDHPPDRVGDALP